MTPKNIVHLFGVMWTVFTIGIMAYDGAPHMKVLGIEMLNLWLAVLTIHAALDKEDM